MDGVKTTIANVTCNCIDKSVAKNERSAIRELLNSTADR